MDRPLFDDDSDLTPAEHVESINVPSTADTRARWTLPLAAVALAG